jgi:HAMP domain-containing protein/signal transduction histidine kinase/PleD family two-component response regulator
MAAKATTARAERKAQSRRATSQPELPAASGGAVDARVLKELVEALDSARRGDFSVRLSKRRKGVMGEVAASYNELVATNQRMTRELVRIARIIGREGRMTERASLPGAAGGWEASIDSINSLIDDLVRPTTEVGRVLNAVAEGDLSQKMALTIEGQSVKGEFLRIGTTVNTMVDQLSSFADEVTRVAREVGTEGKLGGQAEVKGVSGTWRDLTDNVNFMASNLTDQVRNIVEVTTAVAKGDLTQQITVDVKGEVLELKKTVNTMVDQLSSFADEVTRVAREVGTEGKLGGQAEVKGVSGTWADLTESVNLMASNLTDQVRGIADVTTAVANGDLSKKITVEAKGEVAALADTINSMVDTLGVFAEQVTTVAREVGTEGKLGGQAEVPNVAGTWKDLTDSVNFMAGNLTSQVRNIAQITTAVANGDLSQKITVEAKGEVAALADTINSMVDTLRVFAEQVTTVAREVGTEGKLGGQAEVPGAAGTWRDLTDNVNFMAGNLTDQVRNIIEVTTAVANGDLTREITVDAQGEILELKDTVNTMVDQLSSFADEVTRVAREVGTEGKLGGQAEVKGVSGTWRDLTDNVNFMAGNLTDQVRNIAEVTTAVANGDLSKKIAVDAKGEILELKDTINTMVDQLRAFAAEVTRVAREVGTEGKLGGQAQVEGVSGTWRGLTENVNQLASNLTTQVRNIAQVTTAVANGDLSKQITVEAKGEVAELADTINRMVDQLSSFADEVTRVAREVGTEGKLGGQAEVKGVSGTWRDLTDNVNMMASNLTDQVRNIAEVTTAVAGGDLTREITVDAKGEILELKRTINTMVDQLSSFADEVTRVAREVGTEGKLGGQAQVEGVSGTWGGLTENVNQLAGNLTTQVRAIAEVSTAVTQGDLTRAIDVEAQGEVAELKDTINEMIANLRDTTEENAQQDWLKTNLAQISGLMQGQRDLKTVSSLIMSELTPTVSAQLGAFFLSESSEEDPGEQELRLIASYGYKGGRQLSNRFRHGEGLVGQAALEKQSILITEPPDDYIKISSGLGEATPANIIVLPVAFEERVLAVIELASFRPFSDVHLQFLEQLTETIGVSLNTIIANMRTEELLEQSQSLTQELQSRSGELQAQQEVLQQTNAELQEKAALLSQQNRDIEVKNREIEIARRNLEDKAEQLALSSKYKSEFLANMSHELRTPLNSMLILSKLLSDNEDGSLNDKQVEYAGTIHTAGSDLLSLINDILDVSKVEAGKMEIRPAPIGLEAVRDYVERAFTPVAEEKHLTFEVAISDGLPEVITTDEQRLQQVLKNLLSNAFKFTDEGKVTLRVEPAEDGRIAFAVADTGVGISKDKLRLIFEAFQQGEGGTSRKYGGTGLGLTISREIARLLGGELDVSSTLGDGSEFTLYLPLEYAPVDTEPIAPAEPELIDVPQSEAQTNGQPAEPSELGTPAEVADDRMGVSPGDRVLLVVCADPVRAAQAVEAAHGRGFKGLIASRAETGVALAHEFVPDAIVLAMEDDGQDGAAALDHFKRHPQTRHIPVYIEADAGNRQALLRAGAAGHLDRPASREALDAALGELEAFVDRETRRLLVVEDDERQRSSIIELIGSGEDVQITGVASSEAALDRLAEKRFDCMVLDLNLPHLKGFDLLEVIKKDERLRDLPVIVYTGKDLTTREEEGLKEYAEAIIVKDASSPERLLDATSLYLHRPEARLSAAKRRMLEGLHDDEEVFGGKKVLLVDDDVRNVFALASLLESRGMEILFAENGLDGIKTLQENPDVDLVLMDIMMPEMDGYEATRRIRGMDEFKQLPIVALTAKAMRGDREKSLMAGASDYVAKPVDSNRLLSLMRLWLDG